MAPHERVLLRLRSVSMRYAAGAEVLHDIDLTLKAASFRFLVGPSGAGKTSLLRVISLSVPVSRGTITLFGREVGGLGAAERARLRRRIGVVFQDFRLLDHLTVFDNVALPLRVNGVPEDAVGRLVPELLEWMGLKILAPLPPAELSVGERQLVAIARAVITRPDLLLADEPLSNVDARRAERLMYLFTELHRRGTAVILATHNNDLLQRYRFPILEMHAGRLRSGSLSCPLATVE